MQKRGVIVVRATGPLSPVERRPKLSIAGLIRQFRTRHEAIHLRHFKLTTLETFFLPCHETKDRGTGGELTLTEPDLNGGRWMTYDDGQQSKKTD